MNKEIWKPVVGYEDRYEVSNFGRVKSIKILKPAIKQITPNYKSVCIRLSKNSKQVNLILARIIAQAFIPNKSNKQFVNHIDSNPLNNNSDNLEWVTPKENQQHSVKNGRRKHIKYSKKLSYLDVLFIRGNKNVSTGELAKKYKVSPRTIYSVKTNKTWVM